MGDQGQDAAAFGDGPAVDEAGESQSAHHLENDFDMAVRAGAPAGEEVVGFDESFAPEDGPEGEDLGHGPVGDVGEGFLPDPFAVSGGLADEDSRRRGPVGDSERVGASRQSFVSPDHRRATTETPLTRNRVERSDILIIKMIGLDKDACRKTPIPMDLLNCAQRQRALPVQKLGSPRC